MQIKTRFAPSPAGYLHVGGARTALFNWLLARRHGGAFVLRIEDTDQARSTEASVQAIFDGLAWLGLDYDEQPVFQTQRLDHYDAVITQLLDNGLAYRCRCSKARLDALRATQLRAGQTPRYDGHCRDAGVTARQPHVVRFSTPQAGVVGFDDQVHGRIEVPNAQLDDLIIRRTDGTPTYNLTVMVDDHAMGITHVLRGDDHINNTPRQLHIYRALGWTPPRFGHLPMILGADGARLSKRHGAVSVLQYREDGFLPEALLNYLVRLGWSHGDQEVFSRSDMIRLFDVKQINHSPSSFNNDKLLWLNQRYLKDLPVQRLADQVGRALAEQGVQAPADERLATIIAAQRSRARTELELAANVRFYYQDPEALPESAARKAFKGAAGQVLADIETRLAGLTDWQPETIHDAMQATTHALGIGFGKLGQPLRMAVTAGNPAGDLHHTLALVGKDASLRRIANARAWIAAHLS